MSSWHTYPSIYNLGHRAVRDLFTAPVNVEEKVDGSQFSFGIFTSEVECGGNDIESDVAYISTEYELKIRSKGAIMLIDVPEKMFNKAAETVKSIAHLLQPNWTYRAEYLQKPKHNALAYDRVPEKNIIIFDICTDEETYLPYEAKAIEAKRLGLECVPLLGTFEGNCFEDLRNIIDSTTSILGGQKIEGVVCKQVNVQMFGPDKKALIGKFVSEAFKEVHAATWKEDNPSTKDILLVLGDSYGTATRWNKAIQHLREAGKLTDSPKDIGLLVKEIPEDILKECEDEIKDKLFAYAWPQIRRMVIRGFPEFYKEQLLHRQFE